MINTITYLLIGGFVGALLLITFLARRSEPESASKSSEDFVLGGRGIGTVVFMLSMGATYFSTWTLLGAFGSYYREGVWFAGFTVWTVFHGIFIWLFGTRIWLAGKRYGFITPGQMVGHYFHSRRLRLAVAVTGIVALVPYMLIQVTGGAHALEALSQGAVPYVVGVAVMSVMVGGIVLWAGFKGTAWTDTFMGIFFASVMVFTVVFVFRRAGGFELFENVAAHRPDLLVNSGQPIKILELWLGAGFGIWVLPHMWQKFYSASSPEVLGRAAVMTPFWNSWMMALVPLVVGLAAVIPGVVPGVSRATSDRILPLVFSGHAPMLGALVVAGILAAAISTINSQLLSAASIVAKDLWEGLRRNPLSNGGVTRITRIVVAVLTALVFALAMTSGGAGFLVPVASLGFGLALQLVPSALGVLHFRRITEAGAFGGLLAGVSGMVAVAAFLPGIPVGPVVAGFFVNLVVTIVVSRFSSPVSERSISGYHAMFDEYLRDNPEPRSAVADCPAQGIEVKS